MNSQEIINNAEKKLLENGAFANVERIAFENQKKVKNKYKVGTKISNINNLEKGDYVVHIDHGIGQYDEIATLTKNGLKKDYIKLIYADGDVLYLPVEKIDKISKFSGNEGAFVRLDKLGSDNWAKKKARVKKRLESIAGDLIKVSAEREATKGYAFSADCIVCGFGVLLRRKSVCCFDAVCCCMYRYRFYMLEDKA